MKKQLYLGFIIIGSLLLIRCINKSETAVEENSHKRIFPQYSEYTEKIIKSDSSVIRGLNLNVSAEVIKKCEGASPYADKKDTVEYRFQIDSVISYTVKYSLHNDSLEEINVWIYSNDSETTSKIFNELKDYYQKKLPNSIEDKGYVVYNCVQGERRPFVVSISDFSTPNKGQINLVIYKDL
ncbi:MAG: hypothetical protein N2203_04770 [Bacteroidia bacterium]|nr:hypothetical protein [Bacteroidia bacterium]